MVAENIIQAVRQMLKESIDPKILESSDRFFKSGERAKVYGARMFEVGKIAKEFYKEVCGRTKAEIFVLCEQLWHTIGSFVMQYSQYVSRLKAWTKSDNRWVCRGAAVTQIIPVRKGLFFEDVLEIATLMLCDRDDMVQKGYGWMLKAASELHRDEVFDFVVCHKAVMPRTVLRYAIEKMPADRRGRQ